MTKLHPSIGGPAQIPQHRPEKQATSMRAAECATPRVQDALRAGSTEVPPMPDLRSQAVANFSSTVERLCGAANFDQFEDALKIASVAYQNAISSRVSPYDRDLSTAMSNGSRYVAHLLASGETRKENLSMYQLDALDKIFRVLRFESREILVNEMVDLGDRYFAGDAAFQNGPAGMTLQQLNQLRSDTLRHGHDVSPALLNEIDHRVRQGG